MKKLVSTRGLSREDWLRYRKRGIGGSDAGAVCGLDPYRTAMQVYFDKTSGSVGETADNEAMRQGRELEDYVARRFMEATGKKVRRANFMYYDENHPFMLADVDRLVVGENAGLECKTVSPYMAEKWEGGKIPPSYRVQCCHYMSVCNADAWYIAALVYGREFIFRKIERDEKAMAGLVRTEKNFWEGHVLKKVLPPPDGSKLADKVIAGYFPGSGGGPVPLTGFDGKLGRRQEILESMGRLDAEKRLIEQEIKLYMGDAETAENGHYRVSWKPVCSGRLDTGKLKAECPEVYEKYQKTIRMRRFTVEAA